MQAHHVLFQQANEQRTSNAARQCTSNAAMQTSKDRRTQAVQHGGKLSAGGELEFRHQVFSDTRKLRLLLCFQYKHLALQVSPLIIDPKVLVCDRQAIPIVRIRCNPVCDPLPTIDLDPQVINLLAESGVRLFL